MLYGDAFWLVGLPGFASYGYRSSVRSRRSDSLSRSLRPGSTPRSRTAETGYLSRRSEFGASTASSTVQSTEEIRSTGAPPLTYAAPTASESRSGSEPGGEDMNLGGGDTGSVAYCFVACTEAFVSSASSKSESGWFGTFLLISGGSVEKVVISSTVQGQ